MHIRHHKSLKQWLARRPIATLTKPPTGCYAGDPPLPMVVSITESRTPSSKNQNKNKNHIDENSIVASKLRERK